MPSGNKPLPESVWSSSIPMHGHDVTRGPCLEIQLVHAVICHDIKIPSWPLAENWCHSNNDKHLHKCVLNHTECCLSVPRVPFYFLTWINSTPPSAAYMSANWISFGSDNGLAPKRRQAITWTNADLLSIGPKGTNFSEIWIEIQKIVIHENAFENIVCKMVAILSKERWVDFNSIMDK